MVVAMGVVQGEERARRVFDQLRLEGFGASQISIRFLGRRDLPGFPEAYDPLGGARFFGTAVASLPATGVNLVGNSTTVDTSLTTLGDLLATMAGMEREPTESDVPQVRLLIRVQGEGAARAAAILREAGAHPVRLEQDRPAEEPFGEISHVEIDEISADPLAGAPDLEVDR